MLKPISKIVIVLFITFLSGLVMTDSVLPEIQSEERAEIEIEEEEEIEIAHLVQSEFVTTIEDGGGKNKVSPVQVVEQVNKINTLLHAVTKTVTPNVTTIVADTKTPLYILYCVLKLNL